LISSSALSRSTSTLRVRKALCVNSWVSHRKEAVVRRRLDRSKVGCDCKKEWDCEWDCVMDSDCEWAKDSSFPSVSWYTSWYPS
jgi:hypothetical protein